MNNQNSTQTTEVDLLELFYAIRAGKWTILFFTVMAAFLAFIYAYGKTPIYSADTLLQVEKQKTAIPGISSLAGLGGNNTIIGTEIELIKSRKNIGKAVKHLKLDIIASPKRIPLLGNLYKNYINTKGQYEKLPPIWKWFDNNTRQYAWGNEKIDVSRLELPSSLINRKLILTYLGKDAYTISFEETKLLEGRVGKLSRSKDSLMAITVRSLIALPGTTFVVIKLSNLRATERLQQAIKAVEKGSQTGIINIDLEGPNKSLIVSTLDYVSKTYLEQNQARSSEEAKNALEFLKTQIKPVKEKMDIADAKLKTYRTRNNTADISFETKSVLSLASGIDTELSQLSLQKDQLGQKYTKNHPTIQSIVSQEMKLRKRKSRLLTKINKLPEKQQKLLKLNSDYEVANTVYLNLLNKIQEFKIAKASTVGNVYIIDAAVVHDLPIKPKKTLILIVGGLLGMVMGVLMVVLREAFHRTVNNPEKLEEALGIPVYATVPLSDNVKLTKSFNKKNKRQKKLLANDNVNDPAIESLRSLRTSLHFALLEAKNNIVMITGPSPGIGKSFISSNFAAVLAAADKKKVLLIDADMRKGYLHSLFTQPMSPGLSDLIGTQVSPSEVIHTVKVGEHSLDVITRGQTPPNPSELLMHSDFEKLLNNLSKEYDLILIDTPPVHAVTDSSIIGALSGVVFMVVFSGKHSMNEINHAVSRLSHTGIETKGFIFNGYSPKKSKYGYHSYYGDYKSD